MKRLSFILAISAALTGTCVSAQQPTTAQAVAAPTTNTTTPAGYNALILDWEGIRMRMGMEQRDKKGAHWPAWMRPGLADGGSLYWWLLAQWHHNEGNQDLAYRTLLTAWVLTRMETNSCMQAQARLPKEILQQHAAILNAGTTNEKAKQEAVLYALQVPRQMLEDNVPLRGMACNITPAKRAVARQQAALARWKAQAEIAARDGRKPPRWIAPVSAPMTDYRLTSPGRERNAILERQRAALHTVGEEFKVNQTWDAADINSIMNAVSGPQTR